MNKRHAANPAEMYPCMRRLAFGERLPNDPPLPVVSNDEPLQERVQTAESSFERWLIWKQLRQNGHQPSSEQAAQVCGVICEFALDATPVTLVAHEDGNASMYLGTGGGIIGGGGHQNVREAAAALCEAAQHIASDMPLSATLPELVSDGEFVVSVLSPAGIRTARDSEAAVQSVKHKLHPVYWSMHQLITNLRHAEASTPDETSSELGAYANGLLTLLAENGSGDVTITAGESLPRLVDLARTSDQRDWIAKEGPRDTAALDSDAVRTLLEASCRFGWFSRKGKFAAKLAQSNGTAKEVVFEVERGKDRAGRKTLRFRL